MPGTASESLGAFVSGADAARLRQLWRFSFFFRPRIFEAPGRSFFNFESAETGRRHHNTKSRLSEGPTPERGTSVTRAPKPLATQFGGTLADIAK
ncbi:hypothetical protein MRX96_008311 [Rhipicephalus microplus]